MRKMRPWIALIFAAMTALASISAAAQSAPGSGDDSGGAQRPGLFDALMDAMESGSRLLIENIQPGDPRDNVENPQFNSQESPRHAMMTLIEAMALVDRGYEEIGYSRAMASLPEGASRDDARALYEILLRLGPIGPAELAGPNGIEETGDARFEYFPRSMDHQWVWEAADPPADARIALTRQADGRWLFTQGTLDSAPDLLSALSALAPRYAHSDTGQYFLKVFSPLFERTSILGWIAFFGLTGIAIAAGIFFARAMRWIAARTDDIDRVFLASTLRGLGRAGGLVVFTFLFTIAFGFLELGPVLRDLRYEIPRFLMIIAAALLIISVIDVAAAFTRDRVGRDGSHYDRMVVTMVRRILRVFVMTLVLLFLLQNILGVNIGALLVGFGFIALALSLAAQDTVKNVFGAVSVFINRPFVIGDWIVFQGETGQHIGTVEDIQLQATKLQDLNGNLVTLPNMLFIDREVQNLSARGHIRREVNIALPYGGDVETIDKALAAMKEAFDDEDVMKDALRSEREDGAPHVSFSDFKESWLGLRGYHYYFMGEQDGDLQRDSDERGWFSYLAHCSLVNRKIVEKFNERGLEFAFPTQTVHLETEREGVA